MKLKEAMSIYRAEQQNIQNTRNTLSKEKESLLINAATTSNDKEAGAFSDEAATLELSINSLDEKYDSNSTILDMLAEKHSSIWETESSKQECEAAEDYYKDLSKIFEVARRIMKGGSVPATDEKKLMEYSMELYMSAKNCAMMNKLRGEDYDSLWADEEAEEPVDPEEVADNTEVKVDAPASSDIAVETSNIPEGAE